MISSSFSLSINVLWLVILNGPSKSYTISWLYQNLSRRILNDSRDIAVTTVSGRLFHDSGSTDYALISLPFTPHGEFSWNVSITMTTKSS